MTPGARGKHSRYETDTTCQHYPAAHGPARLALFDEAARLALLDEAARLALLDEAARLALLDEAARLANGYLTVIAASPRCRAACPWLRACRR